MARVMPFRLEAMLRAASRLLQDHSRSRAALERLNEQLQLQSSKVVGHASRAEVQDQLRSVLEAVAALADAHDIELDTLTPQRPRRTEAWPLVAANRLFAQPPLAHGRSAMRAVQHLAQRAGRGVPPPATSQPLPARSPVLGIPLAGRPALHELLQLRVALRQALTSRSEQLLTAPSATIAQVRAEISASTQRLGLGRDAVFALLGSISAPSGDSSGTVVGDIDIRAHAQFTPSFAPAMTSGQSAIGERGASSVASALPTRGAFATSSLPTDGAQAALYAAAGRPGARSSLPLTAAFSIEQGPPSGLVGRADLELRLRVRGLSSALSTRTHPLTELLAARRSEIAVWIVSTTSRLLYEHVIRPRIDQFRPQHPLLAALLTQSGDLLTGSGTAAK